ncbi:hypothetical protein J5N97_012043 [Dioscorea zingiberensis]|uniref:Uncharacterized protein n=1 Tax=Dioscorea zingiberensis TaxID=325984 RepID=A0A9D5CPG0_9LILI|nr:hypothetical protein J5N97_012043 [Dioscorea zingiberensis]
MNLVLLFVMWALVAAIPCQDRGLQMHFSIPRNFPWAAPILSLHERILEESKKRDRRNSNGLLKEIHQMEKYIRQLSELTETIQFPLAEDKEADIRNAVQELSQVRESMKEELDLLELELHFAFLGWTLGKQRKGRIREEAGVLEQKLLPANKAEQSLNHLDLVSLRLLVLGSAMPNSVF